VFLIPAARYPSFRGVKVNQVYAVKEETKGRGESRKGRYLTRTAIKDDRKFCIRHV